MNLGVDAGAPTGAGSGDAAGGVIGTSTTAGTTGTGSTSSATSATGSGPSGAGGSVGSGPTGSGGSSGVGGSGGFGGGAGGSGGVGIGGAAGMDSGVVGGVKFSTDVRPIIERRCSSCHSFSTYATFTTHSVGPCGGDVLARANDPANSSFLELVQGKCAGFLMPRGCGTAPCIPQGEIDTVTSWIKAGAPNN